MEEITDKTIKKRQGRPNPNWVKGGPSPNPKGRPKGRISVLDQIIRELSQKIPGQEKTYLRMVAEIYIDKIIKNKDTTLLKDIIDRVDGKPNESVFLSTQNTEPITIKIVYEKDKEG